LGAKANGPTLKERQVLRIESGIIATAAIAPLFGWATHAAAVDYLMALN